MSQKPRAQRLYELRMIYPSVVLRLTLLNEKDHRCQYRSRHLILRLGEDFSQVAAFTCQVIDVPAVSCVFSITDSNAFCATNKHADV